MACCLLVLDRLISSPLARLSVLALPNLLLPATPKHSHHHGGKMLGRVAIERESHWDVGKHFRLFLGGNTNEILLYEGKIVPISDHLAMLALAADSLQRLL